MVRELQSNVRENESVSSPKNQNVDPHTGYVFYATTGVVGIRNIREAEVLKAVCACLARYIMALTEF